MFKYIFIIIIIILIIFVIILNKKKNIKSHGNDKVYINRFIEGFNEINCFQANILSPLFLKKINEKYSTVEEYFKYTEYHKIPRIMILGGCRLMYQAIFLEKETPHKIKNSFKFNNTENINSYVIDGIEYNDVLVRENYYFNGIKLIPTDLWYYRPSQMCSSKNYFFVNIDPESNPDFLCDIDSSKMLELGKNQWDYIIYEQCKSTEENINNSIQLLKNEGTIVAESENYDPDLEEYVKKYPEYRIEIRKILTDPILYPRVNKDTYLYQKFGNNNKQLVKKCY